MSNEYGQSTCGGIFVKNSDNFDALMYAVICFYCDSEHFKQLFNECADTSLISYVQTNSNFGTKVKTYKERSQLLKQRFETNKIEGLEVIDCSQWPINKVVEEFFLKFIPSITGSDDLFLWSRSKQFNISLSNDERLNSILVLDGAKLYNDCVTLSDLKPVIYVNGSTYVLAGIIATKLQSSLATPYYVAHVLRNSKWYTYDTRSSGPVNLTGKTKISVNILRA